MPAAAIIIGVVAELLSTFVTLFIVYQIISHLQAVNTELTSLAKIGGVAIGEAIAPVITGSLVLFAGLGAVAILYALVAHRSTGQPVAVTPLAPIQAPQPVFGSKIGFSGGGVSISGGTEPERSPGMSGGPSFGGGFEGGGAAPRRHTIPRVGEGTGVKLAHGISNLPSKRNRGSFGR